MIVAGRWQQPLQRFASYWLPAVVWMGVIFALSSIPDSTLSQTRGGLATAVKETPDRGPEETRGGLAMAVEEAPEQGPEEMRSWRAATRGWLAAAIHDQSLTSVAAHTVEFAALAALFYRALGAYGRLTRARILGGALALTVGYAVFDELHQMLVPGRHFGVGDLGLDVAGALVGLAAAEGGVRLRGRLRARSAAAGS